MDHVYSWKTWFCFLTKPIVKINAILDYFPNSVVLYRVTERCGPYRYIRHVYICYNMEMGNYTYEDYYTDNWNDMVKHVCSRC